MSTIATYEVDGYPIEEYTRNGNFHAMRKVRIAWGDVDTYVSELDTTDCLYPYNAASGATVYRIRIEKQPGTQLTALAATGLVSYPYAVMTIWYGTDTPRYYSQVWYTEQILPYREAITVSKDKLRWGSMAGTALADHENPSLFIAGHIYNLTLYRVTAIPAGFFDYAGYSNSNTVVSFSLGKSYAPETLVHSDPSADRTVRLGGTNAWELNYHWIFRGANGATWNKQWRLETGAWETVYHTVFGAVVWHPTVNFGLLVP